MERFVEFVCGGGLALLGGLWIAALTPAASVPWFAGALLAVAGLAVALAGVARPLTSPALDVREWA